jgi:DNA repair protein SbcC/Rad50
MINQLIYRISFPSTSKEFSNNLTFAPGLTIIRGPNETGKSLILEMIRYALFGVAALRGDRSDYNTLDVNLTFSVKDKSYRVTRSGNKAFLNGKLATGTAAVNQKIRDILGFDLDVFDIACAAVQGDLDKLTKRMRPAERRKMVEEVIGLNSIEEEEKLCRSESNALKKQALTAENKLVEPQPPEKPNKYESSSVLEALYHKQIEIEAERKQLLQMVEPEAPVLPSKPEFNDDVEEYEKTRAESEAEKGRIERTLQGIPAATRTRQDIEQAILFYEQQALGPQPKFGESELHLWADAWKAIESAGDLVQCPKCGVEFNPTTQSVHSRPKEPPISLREINNELRFHARWAGYTKEIVESTDLTEEEAHEQLIALSQESNRQELLNALGSIPDLPSRAEEAERRRVYLRDLEIYEQLVKNFEPLKDQWDASRERLAELPDSDPTLEERLKESRSYEEQKRRYDADMIAFSEAEEAIKELRDQAEGYFNGAEALKDVRLEAKQHLVPSLNRVASHLLSEMTDAKRTKIEVNEDFDIRVDNQPINTLSGSGISVVSLALRIALGQVLTQKVVPLFLADEIDQDMDAERAEATHASLKKLTNMLDKVIVVTHKEIEGDHIIQLE